MRTPIAVALGDIHLDNRIWTRIHGITGDSIVGYNAFLDVAQRLKVPAIIVGDLFDVAKPTPDIIDAHRKAMDKCAASKTPVYVLQGNHDKQYMPWATATHEHPVYVGDGKIFTLGAHKAQAFDYAAIDEIEPQIRGAEADLLFLHQAVKQALGFENAWNADLEWIPDCVKLTVIGDIHKPMDFILSEQKTKRACYTGPGHPRDMDQVGPKSVVVIYDDLSYSREPIPSRCIKKFQVKTQSDVQDVESWLRSSPTVSGLIPFAWTQHNMDVLATLASLQRNIMAECKGFVYREPLIENEVSDDVLHATDVDDDITPQRLLSRIIKPDDKELFGFLSEIIDERADLSDVILSRKDQC